MSEKFEFKSGVENTKESVEGFDRAVVENFMEANNIESFDQLWSRWIEQLRIEMAQGPIKDEIKKCLISLGYLPDQRK